MRVNKKYIQEDICILIKDISPKDRISDPGNYGVGVFLPRWRFILFHFAMQDNI